MFPGPGVLLFPPLVAVSASRDLMTEATGQMAHLCDRKLEDLIPQINVIPTNVLN